MCNCSNLSSPLSVVQGIQPGLLPELVDLSVGDTRNLTCPLQNKTQVKWCLVTSDSISRIDYNGVSIEVVGDPDCPSTMVQPPVPVCNNSLMYCTDQTFMYHCTDDTLPTKSYYFVNLTNCPTQESPTNKTSQIEVEMIWLFGIILAAVVTTS